MVNNSKPAPFGSCGFTKMQKMLLLPVKLGISRGVLRGKIKKLLPKYYSRDDFFDVERQGLRFRLCPFRNAIELDVLINSKLFEKKEIEHILQMPPDGIFVDIGANIGYHSLVVAKRLPKVRAIAFEVNPIMCDAIRTNMTFNNLNKSITLVEMAVGDKIGAGTFYFSDQSYGGGSLNPNIHSYMNHQKLYDLPITTLTSALQKIGVQKIHALKIDIEGYEDKALLPYFRTTDKENWPNIIVIEKFGREFWEEDVIQFMINAGYKIVYEAKTTNIILELK